VDPLRFATGGRPLRVLALGAHADDIEIGAGATLLQLAAARPVVARAVVFSASPERRIEAEHSAAALFAAAEEYELVVHDFRESYFPADWAAVKAAVASAADFAPDVVFAHRRDDRHQDHRVIGDLAWQACRSTTILQYEIPKYEGDLGQPNAYVAIDDATLEQKIELIRTSFVSQATKPWFDADTFRAMARLRGVECGARWAEAFHAEKFLLAAAGTPDPHQE
jgi:LmbE family N-acetylglucosaminyl deacetylase